MTDCSIRIYGAAALASLLASTAVAQTAPPAPLPAGYAGRDPVRSEWPVQVRQSLGQVAPQDPATLPRSRAPLSKPVAKPAPGGPALTQRSPGLWTVAGWRLAEAPDVKADGATVSRAGYPPDLVQAMLQGRTMLEFSISPTGTATAARVLVSDPPFAFDAVALAKSLTLTYEPAKTAGVPRSCRAQVQPIRWQLP